MHDVVDKTIGKPSEVGMTQPKTSSHRWVYIIMAIVIIVAISVLWSGGVESNSGAPKLIIEKTEFHPNRV